MSRFKNHTTNQQLTIACAMADSILNRGSKLIDAVALKDDWKYGTNMPGWNVSLRLSQTPLEPITIYACKPAWRWSKSVAFTTPGEFAIHFNCYRIGSLSTQEMVSILLHEYSHKAGFEHKSIFPPSNYKTQDKCLYSVPYWLSENAWRYM